MSKPAKPPRPKRLAVLVLVDPEGFVRVYGDKHVDAIVVNVPEASRQFEALAEDVAELLMPPGYRALFRDDRLRATGIARKMKPSALLAARQAAKDIATLNGLLPKGRR